jgi:hypothetical protein
MKNISDNQPDESTIDAKERIILNSLTELNKKQLLKAIDKILDEYAYSAHGVTKLDFDNWSDVDEYRKAHDLLVRLYLVNELNPENFMDLKGISTVWVFIKLKVNIDKLAELKNALTSMVDSNDADGKENIDQVYAGKEAKLSLNSSTKTIRLTYDRKTRNVHVFRSKLDANYVMFKNLYLRPDQALDKNGMGAPRAVSPVKDLPKTMGFIGDLKGIFFTIDTKNKTLKLHPEKLLTPDEAETLDQFVNSKSAKK